MIFVLMVVDGVLLLFTIIDYITGQVGVLLTWISVFVASVVVIDTIGDVRCLLDFC